MRPSPEDLADMAVFARVAQLSGFTAAARELGLSKSAASKAVARLEARLGTRLLQRTTRRVALTEAGRALEARAARMLEEAGAGAEAVAALASRPLGTLRVNGPVALGETLLAPALPTLLARHPGLRVELALEDRLVDAAAGGWDVVVRIAPLADSPLAVRKLAPSRILLVGAPGYLARRGTPASLDDLRGHDCLHYTLVPRSEEWRFRGGRGPISVPTAGPLDANHGLAMKAAVLGGLGLALLPEFMVAADVRAGRLVELLEPFALPRPSWIHALYARGRPTPPKVKVFLDHLAEAVRAARLGAS
ncbi:MAG TPA: LysR family transcriptional regulator [Anaeromyxobacteraceae bacterium]|nr:LysR family transcriptional regulator [Anaeromyxobacteraceae bacterium]